MRAAVLLLLLLGCTHVSTRPERRPGDYRGELQVGGRLRRYAFHLPPAFDGQTRLPLVLALHGRLGDGEGQQKLGEFNRVADARGFIVIYPDGVDRSWADGRGASPASKQGVDDVAFARALLDKFQADYPVDASRVYAQGMSNGGFMALTLACQLADRLTAVGAVAGLLPANLEQSCAPARPISVALFLGTEDPLVPYAGGSLGENRGVALSAEQTRALWARLDGCPAEPARAPLPDAAPGDGTTVERLSHAPCREGTEVLLYRVAGGGHTWPGGRQYLPEHFIGRTSRDLDASEELGAFFARHAR